MAKKFKTDKKADSQRRSKPKGARFKGHGKNEFKRPTKKQIEAGGKRIYAESRPERSDVNQAEKLVQGGNVGGRGFFGLTKGEKIVDVNQIEVGDILLNHSNQFNADNTLKIIGKRQSGNKMVLDSVYWDAVNNKRIGDEEMSISDYSLKQEEYYSVKKLEEGGAVVEENVNVIETPNNQSDNIEITGDTNETTITSELDGNSEIHMNRLHEIIGRKPHWRTEQVGGMTMCKCFLRPYYKHTI